MDVPIRCVCPPKADGSPRHEGDTITLRDTLGFRDVSTIRNSASLIDNTDPLFVAEVLAVLTEGYVVFGVEAWTLVDDKGKPLPVTRQAIRDNLLSDVAVGAAIGDAADDLYGEAVMLPLLNRASTSSPATPTDGSTSPRKATSAPPPTRSKRSSTGSSPTDATGATSPSLVGVSSSLPS